MQSLSSHKRVRDSDESGVDSPEAKRILLDILDESDSCTPSHDLDSFMKTFQDEISKPPEITNRAPESTQPTESPESTESAESRRPELGFLLEASDDELGLPPSNVNNTSSTGGAGTESGELSELWVLDDQITSYGSYDFEIGYGEVCIDGEYVALDGLFDHADVGFGSSEVTWQPETLPAL